MNTECEVWQLSSRTARIYVASSSEWAVTEQRRVTTCLWLRLLCWWSKYGSSREAVAVLHKLVFSSRRKNECLVEQWTSIVIWKYWQGYVRPFVEEDLNFGLMLGSCIITMPLHMKRSLSGSFWLKNRYWNWTIRHTRQIWPSVTFGCSQNWKTIWRADITDIQGHATIMLKSIPEEEFQKCFEQWKHRLTKCTGA
jgi:hypothetical protein